MDKFEPTNPLEVTLMKNKKSAAEGLSDEEIDAGRMESLHDMVAQGSVLMKVETDLYGDPARYRVGVQWLGDDDHREYVASDFRVALDSAINGDPPVADDEKRLVIWDWDEPPKEEIEAIIACLGDDAAQLREANDEDERAANMDEAASMLARLERANRQLFELGQKMHTQLEAIRATTHPASPQGQAGAIPPAADAVPVASELASSAVLVLREALVIAEAALADIGDADREPGDDVAWCEARAAQALPQARAALSSTAGATVMENKNG